MSDRGPIIVHQLNLTRGNGCG